MTSWQWILVMLVGIAVTAVAVLIVASVRSERQDEPNPNKSRGRFDGEMFCALGWPTVEVPLWDAAEAFSIDEAHTLMRGHRDCRLESCPWKRVAFRNLVAAGRIKPDLRSERYAR
jgi:hypothetical protein